MWVSWPDRLLWFKLNSSGAAWKELKHLMRFLSCETSVLKSLRHSTDVALIDKLIYKLGGIERSLFPSNHTLTAAFTHFTDEIWRGWRGGKMNQSIARAFGSLHWKSVHVIFALNIIPATLFNWECIKAWWKLQDIFQLWVFVVGVHRRLLPSQTEKKNKQICLTP